MRQPGFSKIFIHKKRIFYHIIWPPKLTELKVWFATAFDIKVFFYLFVFIGNPGNLAIGSDVRIIADQCTEELVMQQLAD